MKPTVITCLVVLLLATGIANAADAPPPAAPPPTHCDWPATVSLEFGVANGDYDAALKMLAGNGEAVSFDAYKAMIARVTEQARALRAKSCK